MLASGTDGATGRASERVSESLEEFREAFEALMSPTGDAPPGGRIAELERIWHKLRADSDAAISDYVSEMLAEVDEDGVVEAKK